MKFRTFIKIVIAFLSLSGCKMNDTSVLTPTDNTSPYGLGWVGDEDFSNIPAAYSSGAFGAVQLPPSIDLTSYLPPVQTQGQYGTCVAWATAYYAKTATEAIANKYTTSQLSSPDYQISPRDLFTAIPDNLKAKGLSQSLGDCDGTHFTTALNVLQNRGAATVNTVPYSNLGNCKQSTALASWATDAAKHKIAAYRTIEPTIYTIKDALVNKSPVLFGASLPTEFYSWDSNNVLSSGTYGPKPGAHALTIIGYDDNKGVGGAFKVVNSWGTKWGSKGFIWIDYNFMLNKFCYDKGYYVISEPATKTQMTDPKSTGIDLEAWVDYDESNYKKTGRQTARVASVNIYNNGRSTATPQKPWVAYYYYFNAKNAKDVKLLYSYTFTTKNLAVNKSVCANNNCDINTTIPAGSSLSKYLFGNDDGTLISYDMPIDLTGSYYLIWYVDITDVLGDENKSDNYFYVTDYPVVFKNGYAARKGVNGEDQASTSFSFKNSLTINSPKVMRSQFNTAIRPDNLNAYSPQEVAMFMSQMKKNGQLDKKIKEYEHQIPAQNQAVTQAR